ncbi:rab effector Noc2 isoform X1 [Oenanthe melanoleuca]|uniref:rab effector Noc2 isoform X1 n=1 Tax=Oenanthe melanoleuca TaxID=2939378 RepID=UPI0024C0F27A|nr:rab effector Noc2 isoform X1 [Oenanthe melanoleuca]
MADMIFGSGTGPWVCPNDRQLALRAKLQAGWSVHTFQSEKQRRLQALSPGELEAILAVVRRAERRDLQERQRIGRLVERLENMRRNVMGNGLWQCLLCGESLGLLGSSSVFCQDCKKKVCTKCGIETAGAQKRPLWLCKICSEQREWFPVTVTVTLSSAPPAWMTNPSLWDPKALRAGSSRQEWHLPWAVSRGLSSAPRRVARVTSPGTGTTVTPAPLANEECTAEHGPDGAEGGAAFPGSCTAIPQIPLQPGVILGC